MTVVEFPAFWSDSLRERGNDKNEWHHRVENSMWKKKKRDRERVYGRHDLQIGVKSIKIE